MRIDISKLKVRDCCKYILMCLIMLPFLMMFNEGFFRNCSGLVFYSLFCLSVCFLVTNKVSVRLVIWLAMFSAFSLWTLIYTEGGLGSAVVPVVAICIASIASQMEYAEGDYKIIRFLCLVGFLFLCIKSFYFDMYDFGNADIGLSKELINPNTFGMNVAYLCMVFVSLINTDTFKNKMFCVFIFLICMIALNNYVCRTGMVCLLFYMVFSPFLEKHFNGRRLFWLAMLVVVAGVVLPYVYVEMSKEISDFEIAGKNLYSGRQGIWLNMFYAFEDYPLAWLIGLGSNADLWDGHDYLNMHNSYLALLVNFGVVYTALYLSVILKIIRGLCDLKLNMREKKLILAFIAMAFVEGIAESTFTSSGCIGILFFVLGVVMSSVRHRFNLNHHFL